jgi:hypothetical protein
MENDGSSASPARADHKHAREASQLGLPLALTGAVSATRFVGATNSGAPVSGTFAIGDWIIDQSGAIWICTVAGSPGTWVTPRPVGQPTARIHFAGTQSIGNATGTKLTTSTTDWTNGGMTVTSDTIVVPVAGRYRISAGVTWPTNSNTGNWGCGYLKNGTNNEIQAAVNLPPAAPIVVSFADELSLSASDAIGLFAFQEIGGPAATAAGSWLALSLVTE